MLATIFSGLTRQGWRSLAGLGFILAIFVFFAGGFGVVGHGQIEPIAKIINASQPNLTPYQPSGWSDKIVVSNRTGTSTDDSLLTTSDTLYIDWAELNNGAAPTGSRFFTGIYVDGALRFSWFTDPPFNTNNFNFIADYQLGSLSAGQHTIKLVVDINGDIAESNESDNEYSKTITIASASKPNLTPYQPSGWSDKIVVSNKTGTNSDDSPLTSSDTLYIDWAEINNGTAPTGARFITGIYVDGVLKSTWFTDPPLNINNYAFIQDYQLGSLSVGQHTIKLAVDINGDIAETNESDNEYSKTITITSGGKPNITPYQPSGWSDKIVVSNRSGTTTDDSPLTSTDTLFIDWAEINNGTAATAVRFITGIYVDGTLKSTWFTDPPFNINNFNFVADYQLGSLSVGQHTIKLVVDINGDITETNESDNEYTKTITIAPASKPNLTPYQPSGWSDKIVVSNRTGTSTDDSPLTSADTLYIDWAELNNGPGPTAARFSTGIYVDGTLKTTWFTDPPFNSNNFNFIADYQLGSLSVGQHTIKLVVDINGEIAETNESDNEYTKTITINQAPRPNLTPYQPSGWSDKIVVSNRPGTNTDDSPLTSADTLYIDWAQLNNGAAATAARFITGIYVDGTLKSTWFTDPPLNTNNYNFVMDYQLGSLSVGPHTIKLAVDINGDITESNESDNEYTKNITIASPQPAKIRIQPTTVTFNLTGSLSGSALGSFGRPDPNGSGQTTKPDGTPDPTSQTVTSAQDDEGDHRDEFWKWFYQQRAYPFNQLPAGARQRAVEYQETVARPLAAAIEPDASSTQWNSVGPVVTTSPFSWGSVSGRINTIVVDPTNTNTLYLGGAQGGVWKTTNHGATWTALTDNQPSLAMGSIVLDPNNSNIIYAGTGELNFCLDCYYGNGILKSTDGGASWSVVGATTFATQKIGKIAINKANSQIVVVAASNGLYRSTDAGLSWSLVHSGTADDVITTPNSSSTMYAGLDFDGVYKSTDSGATWTKLSNGLPSSDVFRIHLAISTASPSTLLAAVSRSSNSQLEGLYRTTDSGASWAKIDTDTLRSIFRGQGFYNIVVAIHPTNSNLMYVGGVDFARSTDSGVTWTNITSAYAGGPVHPDQHALTFDPQNPSVIWLGCDGGLWRSDNGGDNWVNLNNAGLSLTQFQSVAVHPTNASITYGGTQDNGTQKYTGVTTWSEVDGGDGGTSIVDFANPTTVYDEYVYLSIKKSTNSGGNWVSATNGIPFMTVPGDDTPRADGRTLFYSPFTMDPSNSQRLAAGTYRVWYTTDGAGNWVNISNDLTNGGLISAVTIASGGTRMWVGTTDNLVWRGDLVGSTWNWTNVTKSPLPGRYVTRIAAHPTNPQIAYAAFSGFLASHVMKTTDGGNTWVNASSGIPDIPVNAIIVDPSTPTTVYAGTDIGVYRSTDSGSTWVPFGTGLPNVTVFDMGINGSAGILRVATHGRGIWEIATGGSSGGNQQSFTIFNDGGSPLQITGISKQNSSAWLSITPPSSIPFTIAPGGSAQVQVSVSTSGISPGSYSDRLLVTSNDSANSPYPGGVNVNLTFTDTNAPTSVQVTAPTSGQTISGSFALKGTALDDSGSISKTEFYIDSDGSPACTDSVAKSSGSTFQCTWDTKTKGNGSHTVKAKSYDSSNNSAFSSTLSFTISNADITVPTNVQVTVPTSGQTILGTFALNGSALDDSGSIAKMEFYIDSDASPACTDSAAKSSGSTFQCSWDTRTKGNGSHTVKAKAFDPSNNSTLSSTVSFTINNADVTAPTNVQVTAPTSSQTISGSFALKGTALDDSGSISKTEFYIDSDASPACADSVAKSSGSTFQCTWDSKTKGNGSHTVKAKAYDPSNNSTLSSTVSFTINNADVTAPTNVQVTAPTGGQTISGSFALKGTAQDDSGTISMMEFYIDSDVTAVCTDSVAKSSGSTFQCTWDSKTKGNGSHTVKAKAYDPSNNSTSSSTVSFTINNADVTAPTNVQVTAPTGSQTVAGNFALTGTALDDSGTISKIEFYIDSDASPVCTDGAAKSSGSTFQCTWDSKTKGNGSHTVKAKAYDPSSNSTLSSTVSFTINNADVTAPTNVQVTAPTGGQTISGSFALKGTAQDDSGTLSKMEFYIDSDVTAACTDSVAKPSGSTFQCTWDSTLKPNGTHTVRSRAYDPANNQTSSGNISFTISNTTSARIVRVVNQSGSPGSVVTVPVEMDSQGNENAISFSLVYDQTVLSFMSATRGSSVPSAQFITNSSQTASGRLGLSVGLDPGATFTAGTRQIALVNFTIAGNTGASSALISFGDQPVKKAIADPNVNPLTGTYNSGLVTISHGFEGDVDPRPNGTGDGTVDLFDWVREGRIIFGLDPSPTASQEFQRVDVAPRSTLGDGSLDLLDWVQVGRYFAGLDPVVPAGGPAGSVQVPNSFNLLNSTVAPSTVTPSEDTERVSRLVRQSSTNGQTVFALQLAAQGNENAISFSLNFDTRHLAFSEAVLAGGAEKGALIIDRRAEADGRIGIALALPPGELITAGDQMLAIIKFTDVSGGISGQSAITFGDLPFVRHVADGEAHDLPARYLDYSSDTVGPYGKINADTRTINILESGYPLRKPNPQGPIDSSIDHFPWRLWRPGSQKSFWLRYFVNDYGGPL